MRFSTKHPSDVTCSAVINVVALSKGHERDEKDHSGYQVSRQRIHSRNREMNKLAQIKPIQTKKPVCTLAFKF